MERQLCRDPTGSCQRSRWCATVGETVPLRFLVFSNLRSLCRVSFPETAAPPPPETSGKPSSAPFARTLVLGDLQESRESDPSCQCPRQGHSASSRSPPTTSGCGWRPAKAAGPFGALGSPKPALCSCPLDLLPSSSTLGGGRQTDSFPWGGTSSPQMPDRIMRPLPIAALRPAGRSRGEVSVSDNI